LYKHFKKIFNVNLSLTLP